MKLKITILSLVVVTLNACQTRPLTAQQRMAAAASVANVVDGLGVGAQAVSNTYANVANTYGNIAAQQAINNANMTNFLNGQLQSARMSSINRDLSGINTSLMYMQRSTPTFAAPTFSSHRW